MTRFALAILCALLALPAAAQVEIRGLTIAAPDKPGNGGIMLKSLLSTRLPGAVSEIMAGGSNHVLAVVGGQSHRLYMRNGDLVHERNSEPNSAPTIHLITGMNVDLDGDGVVEAAHVEDAPARLAIKRGDRELASVSGHYWNRPLEYVDVLRSGKRQVLAVSRQYNCLRVFVFSGDALTDVGSLSCGTALVGTPVQADIDGDGRYDLIVARQPDRIELFLR